jgi:RNA polymerase sigma-70 factor (ECF subfamily)
VVPDGFDARLAAAKAGDEGAFVTLFRSVQPALLRYLTTLGGGLAEDVASDTWVTVVRSLHKFSGDERGWRSWVFTIAHSRLRDAQRSAVRTPVPVDTDDYLGSRPSAMDVLGEVEEMFSTESALALIGTLPPDQAEMVLLRHVAGLEVSHVAQIVGKQPGTVRVAVHRGLKRLAALLEERETRTTRAGCNDFDASIGN